MQLYRVVCRGAIYHPLQTRGIFDLPQLAKICLDTAYIEQLMFFGATLLERSAYQLLTDSRAQVALDGDSILATPGGGKRTVLFNLSGLVPFKR